MVTVARMDAAVGVSERPAVRRDGRQIALAGCGLAGLVVVAVAATVAGSGAAEQPVLVALARALMVGAPIGNGQVTENGDARTSDDKLAAAEPIRTGTAPAMAKSEPGAKGTPRTATPEAALR